MHELALSQSIVASLAQACGVPMERVRVIALRVGALSSVSVSALEFCMRAVLDERGLPGADLRITWVPARLQCTCGHAYTGEDVFAACPECGGYGREVLDGKDVTVEYMEVDDEESEPGQDDSGD